MMTFFDGGKHVWLATAATEGLLARKQTTKIVLIGQTNHEGTHGTRGRQSATAVTTTSHKRPANMKLSHPCQPPQLPCLLRRSVSEQPTIRAETPTRANQVPFALATYRRRRYGTPDPYADGTVGDTSFAFKRCSSACRSPYTWRGTNYFCQEPTGSYVA